MLYVFCANSYRVGTLAKGYGKNELTFRLICQKNIQLSERGSDLHKHQLISKEWEFWNQIFWLQVQGLPNTMTPVSLRRSFKSFLHLSQTGHVSGRGTHPMVQVCLSTSISLFPQVSEGETRQKQEEKKAILQAPVLERKGGWPLTGKKELWWPQIP